MPNFSYSVFGFNILSEFECPEFQPGDSTPDVTIKLGEVTQELANPEFSGVRFQAKENEFLLKVDNVASYYVANNQITIQLQENSDMDSVRVFLYGSAFAALLMQNKILPLHANAIEKDGKAFLIAGDSGAGKSTISTALYKKGYNILSDDVTVLKIEDGVLRAMPGIIYPKLWEQTLEQLGEDMAELQKIRPQLNKYRFTRIENNYNDEHRIQNMFVLSLHNRDKIEIEEFKAHKKLACLMNNTFRRYFITGNSLKSEHFSQFSRIAGKIKIWGFSRPKELNTIDEIVKLIESKLKQ